MNEVTQFNQLNDAIKRRYGIQGLGPVGTFASDAFPFVNVSDDALAPELHWLAGSRLCGVHVQRLLDAANQSAISLDNPANSGVIAVLERAQIWCTVAGQMFVTMADNAALGGSTAGFFRDGRGWPATPLRTSCVGGTRVGAFSSTLGRMAIPVVNTAFDWTSPIVLTPGERITFATAAVNISVDAVLIWRERRMVQEETGD